MIYAFLSDTYLNSRNWKTLHEQLLQWFYSSSELNIKANAIITEQNLNKFQREDLLQIDEHCPLERSSFPERLWQSKSRKRIIYKLSNEIQEIKLNKMLMGKNI